MLTETNAKELAREVIEAWNSHDLERILAHYEEDATLTSPLAARKLGDATVRGKTALRAYFALGLELFPELHFDLVDVLWGVSSVVLYYVNQHGTMTAEVHEIAPSGRIASVLANYSNGPRPK